MNSVDARDVLLHSQTDGAVWICTGDWAALGALSGDAPLCWVASPTLSRRVRWSMRTILASLSLIVLIGQPALALAGDWQVRRSSRGVCSLQPSDTMPLLGTLLSKSPTRKEACESARSLKGDDRSHTASCARYTPNTLDLCRRQNVELTK
jgi:hypothetical protein